MPLLPPKLVGPITPVAGSIRVEQVLPGAWVEIQVNGTATGQVAMATTNAVDVPVVGSLTPGALVTATWSLGGETSKPSLPQQVLNYPADLGAPVFLSPVHTAMDWVELGVLYPGATVTIHDGGGTVVGGPETAAGASLRVRIQSTIAGGERLYARQSVDPPGAAVVDSPEAESLPAEEWFPREEQPSVPVVIGPIRECDGAVQVGGAVHGCEVRLRVGGRDLDFAAVGATFWAVLPELADASDTYAASNRLVRLDRDSAFSAAVGVDSSAPLDRPHLAPDVQYCPQVVSVAASDLAPRAALSFELRGASGSTALYRAGAPDDRRTDTYFLGDLSGLVPAAAPFPAVVLGEQVCDLTAESNRAGLHRRAGMQEVPPGFFLPPKECATAVNVVNAGGSVVSIRSDAPDWSVLASSVVVPSSGWVPVNRPLRRDEQIWVTVEAGCIPAHLQTSERVTVESADLERMRIVEPVRPGRMRTVYLEDAVPGSRVHVYVDGRWRASATALPTPGQAWTEVSWATSTKRTSLPPTRACAGERAIPRPPSTSSVVASTSMPP